MIKKIIFIGLALFMCACSPSPEAVLIDSLAQFESIMRANVDKPDELVKQLRAFNDANQDSWRRMHEAFDTMDSERATRKVDQHSEEIRKHLIAIVSLDLEIQDRLANDPERLAAYTDTMLSLGILDKADNQ